MKKSGVLVEPIDGRRGQFRNLQTQVTKSSTVKAKAEREAKQKAESDATRDSMTPPVRPTVPMPVRATSVLRAMAMDLPPAKSALSEWDLHP